MANCDMVSFMELANRLNNYSNQLWSPTGVGRSYFEDVDKKMRAAFGTNTCLPTLPPLPTKPSPLNPAAPLTFVHINTYVRPIATWLDGTVKVATCIQRQLNASGTAGARKSNGFRVAVAILRNRLVNIEFVDADDNNAPALCQKSTRWLRTWYACLVVFKEWEDLASLLVDSRSGAQDPGFVEPMEGRQVGRPPWPPWPGFDDDEEDNT